MRIVGHARWVLLSAMAIGFVVTLGGHVTARTAQAADEDDPWYEEALASGIGTSRSPIIVDQPDRPRRITVDERSASVGAQVVIHHLAFRPGERIIEWTYKYLPSCPNHRCFTRVYIDAYTVDQFGNYDFVWDTTGVATGTYVLCTDGISGCRQHATWFDLTPAKVDPWSSLPYGPDTCLEGYVWRDASPADHVCVTPDIRAQAATDNRQALSRRQPGGGAYGPDTCRQGYVWRDAFDDDHVCVSPDTRDQAAFDNSQAVNRRVRH